MLAEQAAAQRAAAQQAAARQAAAQRAAARQAAAHQAAAQQAAAREAAAQQAAAQQAAAQQAASEEEGRSAIARCGSVRDLNQFIDRYQGLLHPRVQTGGRARRTIESCKQVVLERFLRMLAQQATPHCRS
jgi:hypothetical protein